MVFCLYSCINPSQETASTQLDSSQINETFDRYISTINSGDYDKIPDYFSNSSSFYWVEDGIKVYQNKESMVSSLQSFGAAVSSISMTTKDLEITRVTDQAATLFCTHKTRFSFKSGQEMQLDGAMTILVIKEDGGWKFQNGHLSGTTRLSRGHYEISINF